VEPLLTVEDVADLLRCSRATVYRAHRELGLPAVKPAGDLRFRASDLEKWLSSRRAKGAAS
jgi:excisionase family DNA binding protein